MKRNFKIKINKKKKCKKISDYLLCQNQAVNNVHISLLKELARKIEGKVPQDQL